MKADRLLTLEDIKNIPANQYPFMVFSDNVRGFFSLAVKMRTKGVYGHFMWLIGPDELASQWLYFRRFHVENYRNCTLKLVYNPHWSPKQKKAIIDSLRKDLDKPWWKTRYDVLAILGQLIGWDWIQTPWLKICSDWIDRLRLVDNNYDLKYPSPADANAYTKAHNPPYKVYGRYVPD